MEHTSIKDLNIDLLRSIAVFLDFKEHHQFAKTSKLTSTYLWVNPKHSFNKLLSLYNMTDSKMSHIAQFYLKELDLSYCKLITDSGLQHLSRLPLEKLDLIYCDKITDAGFQHLSHLPLKELNLSECKKITDTCLQYLSHLPLRCLDKGQCLFTNIRYQI